MRKNANPSLAAQNTQVFIRDDKTGKYEEGFNLPDMPGNN